MNISSEELRKLIADKTYSLYQKNQKEFGSNVVLPSFVMQMSVYATLQVLEELGFLKLPEKQ